jgi:hypothetical protein
MQQVKGASEICERLGDGVEFLICLSHRILGDVCRCHGKKEKAIYHLETALGVATPFNWHMQLFCIHHRLPWLFYNRGDFDSAQVHLSHEKFGSPKDVAGVSGKFTKGRKANRPPGSQKPVVSFLKLILLLIFTGRLFLRLDTSVESASADYAHSPD